jgi:hypothetical protein
MKYRNWIPEPGMTIFGFADNNKKIINSIKEMPLVY